MSQSGSRCQFSAENPTDFLVLGTEKQVNDLVEDCSAAQAFCATDAQRTLRPTLALKSQDISFVLFLS